MNPVIANDLADDLARRHAPPRPSTPGEARDEIAAMIIDASTELATQAEKKSRLSANRKLLLRLSERLLDIGERIAAITY